ncbi:ferritin-like domain-containing protein [Desulfotomaculum copahuensis]|uniref:Rubrerythrin n=1 Tax=Desulfotomaculum copahuensis TaxID=1838280 RepID=A0A1B7LF52_9FIRM|nr:ferritin-like domain-containing protein [Desulfotomaculum copahuensis]OAT82270.1 rubrerythrin [Desulfotomaculum copahuensis]
MSDATKGNNDSAGAAIFHYPPGNNPNYPMQSPYPGYPGVVYKYHPTYEYVSIYALPEAVDLIAKSVGSEREDELFYDYLLSVAPPAQRDVISSIRDDERKHFRLFKELYWELTGRDIPPASEVTFKRPDSYCEGISRALFGELAAVERYRKILFGFEFIPYRNILTEIYTDELKHASKWNYLFSLNACHK